MADAKANTAVPTPAHGDHDRVQMLSLRADGTPDQTAGFEIIGDREVALEQAREQFAQQAVSAVDQAERTAAATDEIEDLGQDPVIEERLRKHEAAAKAAEAAAARVIDEKFTDDPADTAQSSTSAKSGSTSSK
ncbi:hypothetical protein [Kineosporia succinea]|uniref:Uncharacterized protein n=1 Tax=Kineosporia succinea TaxID=84632 RepID=A0ABT9P5T5_9ACTN|nr:hypothetical protein [Kineosporia succinea]MDP9828048.1 hypothetical protein [Kineosporia succinea]